MIIIALVIARKGDSRSLGVDKNEKCKFALSIIPYLTKTFRSEDVGPDLNLGQKI